MVNINQVPMSAVNSLIDDVGATQAISLLEFEHYVGRRGSGRNQDPVCEFHEFRACSGRRPWARRCGPFRNI